VDVLPVFFGSRRIANAFRQAPFRRVGPSSIGHDSGLDSDAASTINTVGLDKETRGRPAPAVARRKSPACFGLPLTITASGSAGSGGVPIAAPKNWSTGPAVL